MFNPSLSQHSLSLIDLSIIIVNWNSADFLQACLTSIYKTVQETRFEVIVADNASVDGCEAMLRHDYPEVRFIGATENLGFARANNVAYLQSRGETLLFLNPDTELMESALDRMFGLLQAHPSIGALGPRLYNADGTVQESCVQAFPTLTNQFLDASLLRKWFPRWSIWGACALDEPERGPIDVDAISGACFMVSRGVFESVGRFTEDYFMYSDDLDLSYKIRRAGYSVVCLTNCAVRHYGGGSSSRRDPRFAAVQRRQAMSQFFRRTRGPWCSGAYRVLVSAAAILRMGVACIALPFAASSEKRDRLQCVLIRWRSILRWALGIEMTVKDIQSFHV